MSEWVFEILESKEKRGGTTQTAIGRLLRGSMPGARRSYTASSTICPDPDSIWKVLEAGKGWGKKRKLRTHDFQIACSVPGLVGNCAPGSHRICSHHRWSLSLCRSC